MKKNNDQKNSIAVIILAAGASRRMGQSKQLLPYKGQTLLNYITKCAIASLGNPVIVILGANAEKIKPELASLPINIIKNNHWNQGISSSIGCGIGYIQKQDLQIDGVVFLTCDQPFVSAKLIKQLIDAYYSNNKPIIASQYEETLGIPALFSHTFFPELMHLKGDRGAKKIINKYPDLVYVIDFPQGKIDLDTLENYQHFIQGIPENNL
ncbi:nucleotidyltransferase family protein [Crocosphaera sp.]|uniref:nucleotidyltransferase family protein n=1 Tax=Crocosphaera sp. TaxID=2729996 RepID=UPI00263941B4|nr:nucleotidyltransferase family protein [Crocosphaera sp.]MDJ0580235.1 nucleotidyltransferase family protein [Crocosphaera sp.]